MKQIKCELCGSVELIKQDGVYVCQHCGTKYSVEEAKKMMVDGVVEVVGKVKIDNSEQVANLYQVARRAKDDNHADIAAKHYEKILADDPNSWEAVFYTVYFKAIQCRVGEIPIAATSIYNCTSTVLELIRDTVKDTAEQETAVCEVANRVLDISNAFYNNAVNAFYNIGSNEEKYVREYLYRAFSAIYTTYNLGNQLEVIFENQQYACDLAVSAWKAGIKANEEVSKVYKKILKDDDSWSTIFKDKDIKFSLFNGMENITVYDTRNKTDLTIEDYKSKIEEYDAYYRVPKKKFMGSYHGQKGKLTFSGNGHLWVAGSEIFCKPSSFMNEGDLSEVLHMKIADIVNIEKTNAVLGVARGLFITDKNENYIGFDLVGGSKGIISAIEENRKKLGCPKISIGGLKEKEIAPKSDMSAKLETESSKPKPTTFEPDTPPIPNEAKVLAETENTKSANKLGCLLWGLCFILPLVGLILFFVYNSKGEKSKAKSAIIAAAIGFVLFLLLLMI